MARYVPDVVRFKETDDELPDIVLDKVPLPLDLALIVEDPDILGLGLRLAGVPPAEALEVDALGEVGDGPLLPAVESTGVVASELLADEPVPCRGRRTLKSSIPPTGACCTRG